MKLTDKELKNMKITASQLRNRDMWFSRSWNYQGHELIGVELKAESIGLRYVSDAGSGPMVVDQVSNNAIVSSR